jgi:hypothetical protein
MDRANIALVLAWAVFLLIFAVSVFTDQSMPTVAVLGSGGKLPELVEDIEAIEESTVKCRKQFCSWKHYEPNDTVPDKRMTN